MGDLVVTILIFVGVLAVTTVLFGGWLVASLVRGTWRLIDRGSSRGISESSVGRSCDNPGCRTINPPHARFCRRCGTDLGHIAGPGITRDASKRGLRLSDQQSKLSA